MVKVATILQLGPMYRWKLGDCLASIAIMYQRPSSDWKFLYKENESLFFKRFNRILEGDLIKIPEDWLPLKNQPSYDATKIPEGNQNYHRESFIKQFYGNIQRYKETADDVD